MQYVIVRSLRDIEEDRDTVACVYGPFDEQGASAAYRKLVAAGLAQGRAYLTVRGLYPTGDTPVEDPWAIRTVG